MSNNQNTNRQITQEASEIINTVARIENSIVQMTKLHGIEAAANKQK